MNAKPAPYSLPVLIPGFTVQWDGAAVWTKFDDYRATISGVVTETATGRQWRCHAWADRAGFPLRDGVQLNYLGKRAGAPVQPNHIPNAWAIVRAAWNDLCIEMRDAMAAEEIDRESMSGPERRALRRAEENNAEAIKADVRRRVESFVPAIREEPATVEPEAAAYPVRRDNVEYHNGKAARRAGKPETDCPYLAGGERAARWTLGWNEGAPAVQTIDMTPTWAEILPALLAAYTDGTAEGRRIAAEELQRMATIADSYVAAQKALRAA